jgi:hypothetical protein
LFGPPHGLPTHVTIALHASSFMAFAAFAGFVASTSLLRFPSVPFAGCPSASADFEAWLTGSAASNARGLALASLLGASPRGVKQIREKIPWGGKNGAPSKAGVPKISVV